MRSEGYLLALISLGALAAQSAFGNEQCARIEDSAKRLLCYDLSYRKTQSSQIKGAWHVVEETSKISDVKNVVISLESLEPLRARFGQKRHANLILACRERKTDAYIIFGGHFMSDLNHGTVTYRIDKRPAVKKRMQESNDHQALGLWGGANAIPFIKELIDGQTLYVVATPLSESAVTAEFPISGLAEAIKPLQAACAWQEERRKSSSPKQ
ncbi:type VI secretion system-associated protein TagO [Pseudorhodoplanes sp.]|uniref:type VI secretion system-associated protein TagO n=1 Tax=Pseudorhodoplanes sp. TaxID=1934341 RepID=UPI002B7CE780|nr:type VI secretion system-associated protein TagO [Pseudorhodoplanes sp.]HWV51326.1 type VI secretion system-associated protein TagO [Pseudorhodoplanes sp.]